MSLFQLFKSVTSVLNHETQEENSNISLQTDTRKEVSQTLVFLLYSAIQWTLRILWQLLSNKKLICHLLKSMEVSGFWYPSQCLARVSAIIHYLPKQKICFIIHQ